MAITIQSETAQFFGERAPQVQRAHNPADVVDPSLQKAAMDAKASWIRHQRTRLGAAVLATTVAVAHFVGIEGSGKHSAAFAQRPAVAEAGPQRLPAQIIKQAYEPQATASINNAQISTESQPKPHALNKEQIQLIDSFAGRLDQQRRDFLKALLPAVMQTRQNGAPINAAVAIAQGLIESQWGAKAPEDNYYGIKAGSDWTGPVVEFVTREEVNGQSIYITDKFRAYKSLEESVADYGNLIGMYYPTAAANKDDVNGYLEGLRAGGYATDSNYLNLLKTIIEENQLQTLTSL